MSQYSFFKILTVFLSDHQYPRCSHFPVCLFNITSFVSPITNVRLVVRNRRFSSSFPERVLSWCWNVNWIILSKITCILGANIASVFCATMDTDTWQGQVVVGLDLMAHGDNLNLNTIVGIFRRLNMFLGFIRVNKEKSLEGRVMVF